MTVTVFCGGYALTENGFVKRDVWVQDGYIIEPNQKKYDDVEVVDCYDQFITPGLLDLKINGIFTVDLTQVNKPEQLIRVCELLPSIGVTGFCASITRSQPTRYNELIDLFRASLDYMRNDGTKVYAKFLGVYIDGPFQNSAKDQSRQWEGPITPEVVESYLGSNNWDIVRIIALAPELEGAVDVIKYLTAKGVMVSLSHTQCTIEQAEAAVNAGATLIGHLFNGMPNFHHRDPSLVGILASDKINAPLHYGLIADTVHTHPASILMAHKVHEAGLLLISDFAVTSDESEGVVKSPRSGGDGVAIYKRGTDSLMGSCTPLLECCGNFVHITDLSAADGIKACTARPAAALRREDLGELTTGKVADLVIFDRHLNINRVYIDSKRVNLQLQKPLGDEILRKAGTSWKEKVDINKETQAGCVVIQ